MRSTIFVNLIAIFVGKEVVNNRFLAQKKCNQNKIGRKIRTTKNRKIDNTNGTMDSNKN